MKLYNRLATIASKVATGSIVADIGTDHAFIPVFLVKNKTCNHVIACDINKGPLERAKKYIILNGLNDKIETRLGSGLTVIKTGEVDTILIAGMGGMLIKNIFEASPEILEHAKKLILQPMIGQEVVREWLMKNNFRIIDESLAKEEDKLYQIIVAEHGNEQFIDEIYFEVGKRLFEKKDPLLKEFLDKKVEKIRKVINQLENENTPKSQEKMAECKVKLEKYLKLLNEI